MAPVTDTVSLEEIRRARDVVADVARDTQVIESRYLSRTTGGTIALKAENLQRTGSFKFRGALNKIASLDPSVTGRGHRQRGQPRPVARLCRPRPGSERHDLHAGARHARQDRRGPRVRRRDPAHWGRVGRRCIGEARAFAEAEGLAFVHPFDDPAVIAGQGTIGLELLDEVPDLSRVLVPVGGGGLAAGVASAIKESRDGVEVIGIQSHCPLADGIAVKHPGEITGPLLERLLDDLVTVDEDAIAEAIMLLLERTKLVVEGAGAVGVAALRQGAVEPAGSGKTVAILSGGNIDLGVLADIARHRETERGRRLRIFTKIADEPGSLAALLTCLGEGGANLIDVDHVREGVGLAVSETGVELVMETRGPEHAKRLLEMIEDLGYKPDVLS